MPENSFDVLLRFLIDQASVNKTKSEVDKLGASIGDESKESFGKSGAKSADAFTEGMNRVLKVQMKGVIADAIATGIDRAANVALVAGTTIAGALIKASTDYIKNTKESTQVTREWKAATDSLKSSYSEIGRLSAEAVLPVLQLAASVARNLSNIAQQNPGLIKGGLQIGAALLVVGTIGKAVASGIRLVADVTYITASGVNLTSATTMLTAAGINLTAAGGMLTAASAFAVAAAPIVLAVVALGAAIAAGVAVYDAIAKATGMARVSTIATGGAYAAGKVFGKVGGLDEAEGERKAIVFAALIGRLTGAIDENSPLWIQAANSVKRAGDIIKGAITDLQVSMVDAFIDFQRAEAEINSSYKESVAQVNSDYAASLQQAAAQNATAMQQIASASAAAVASIVASFEADMANMASQYAAQQASIIAAGAEQIRQIQENAQEQLIQLARQHAKRVEQLTNARDALGLAQENRDYKEQQADIKRQAQQAIAAAKRNTQLQLQQAEQAYEQQVAQREAQYEADLAAEQAASAAQYAAQDAAYKEQLKALEAQKQAELKALDEKHRKELQENRQAFAQQLSDLSRHNRDTKSVYDAFYAQSLADLQAWADAAGLIIAGLNTSVEGTAGLSTQEVHDYSGYAYTGTYRMAQNGLPQWVMSGQTTAAMERMVGGKLTEQSALSAMGGGNQYVTVQAGNGVTLMQVKRELRGLTNDLSKSLTAAFGAI